jgi:hypothetical protein
VTVASQHQALEFFSKFRDHKITADSDVSQGLEINKLLSRGIKFRMSFLNQMTCSRKLLKGGPDKSFVTQEELCIVAQVSATPVGEDCQHCFPCGHKA